MIELIKAKLTKEKILIARRRDDGSIFLEINDGSSSCFLEESYLSLIDDVIHKMKN